MPQNSILIVTLDTQPQIVTLALDALLARGETIRKVIVIYLSTESDQITQALDKVQAEFRNGQYNGQPCRFQHRPIRDGLNRISDIQTEAHIQATWEMLQELVVELKKESHRLHVCVSGGRRILALLFMSVASQHQQFYYFDRLWHIYSSQDFMIRSQDGAIMHAAPEDDVYLIQVPLMPLNTNLLPFQNLEPVSTLNMVGMNDAERIHCQNVVDTLTPRELEALESFACGLAPQGVAEEMNISINTVNTYRKKIFELCRIEWPERKNIRYHHLREWFGPYFDP